MAPPPSSTRDHTPLRPDRWCRIKVRAGGGGVLGSQDDERSGGREVLIAEHLPEALERIDNAQRPIAERIAHHVRGILSALDLDLSDPNLAETDLRVARMYLEMFQGLAEGAEPKVTTFPNQEG